MLNLGPLSFPEPAVMGILNVTPDSFSDGGQFDNVNIALRQAATMLDGGAAIIDIGGESTRPGANSVSPQEELDRIIPVIEAVKSITNVPVSIDTSKAEVMREAVAAGAGMINDIYALRGEGALQAAADLNVPVCLMHMQGKPRTMQQNPHYDDVVTDVAAFSGSAKRTSTMSSCSQICDNCMFATGRYLSAFQENRRWVTLRSARYISDYPPALPLPSWRS
jgi:dihydropteroate synthase